MSGKSDAEWRRHIQAGELLELRAEMTRLKERVDRLERENAAWRESFSRGCMPPPRPIATN
jgi:predicted nuclease with TOPRIM domain